MDLERKYRKFNLKLRDTKKIVREFSASFREDGSRCLHSVLELGVFYEMAYGLHSLEKEGYIYHAGIFQGGSLCMMGLGVQKAVIDGYHMDCPILAMDPYCGNDEWSTAANLTVAKAKLAQFGLDSYVCPILYDDVSIFNWKIHKARLIFIDTAHSYQHTKLEIDSSLDLISDSAWMLFHDFNDDSPGVVQAVHEFMDNCVAFYIIDTFFIGADSNSSLFGMYLKRK